MPESTQNESADAVIRALVEGTAAHTGPDFFAALVKHLASAIDVAGAWVTELSPDAKSLRALSFWFQDHYVPNYEYAIEGTPCEQVVTKCSLFHVPENVIELFPFDSDLATRNAVSYLGLPLLNEDGSVLGHMGALDVRRLSLTPDLEAIFRIFGARAAAEVRRLRSEQRTRDREGQLISILDSAWESILVVDEEGYLCEVNQSAQSKFGLAEENRQVEFASLLSPDALPKWQREVTRIGPPGRAQAVWIGGLEFKTSGGAMFPAEASVSSFFRDGRRYRTIILRDLQEQRETERRLAALQEESRQLRDELADLQPVGEMLGESQAMRTLFRQIRQVAPTNSTVLILGETGVGKELVARAIHEASPRKNKRMVRVNCGAIPVSLMESEFFGHEKGAFTGATDRREGRFALADGGTLFLDEIGELAPDLQVKLLRVLQEGEFEAVGSTVTRKVDVRVVAATNRDLAAEVDGRRFRADLYYRLSVFPVHIPPLRDRIGDVGALAQALLGRIGRKLNRRFRPLSRAVIESLQTYTWPGNVRELENVLERSAILAQGDEIIIDHRLLPVAKVVFAPPIEVPESSGVLTAADLDALERTNIIRALQQCAWRVSGDSGAAKLLGIAPSTFTSRMKALGISRSNEKSPRAVS